MGVPLVLAPVASDKTLPVFRLIRVAVAAAAIYFLLIREAHPAMRALWTKRGGHGLELVAPVVAPGEAGEVALGMVWAKLAVGPSNRALDVAEGCVDPFEGGRAGRLGSRAGEDWTMAAGALTEHTPTAEDVGDDLRSRRQPVLLLSPQIGRRSAW